MEKELTYKEIRKNKEINTLLERGNEVLGSLGYTDHSAAHAAKVADTAGKILEKLGYSGREAELPDCRLYARYWKQCQPL